VIRYYSITLPVMRWQRHEVRSRGGGAVLAALPQCADHPTTLYSQDDLQLLQESIRQEEEAAAAALAEQQLVDHHSPPALSTSHFAAQVSSMDTKPQRIWGH